MKAVAAILLLALAASHSARGAATDYLRQVKPVLAEHCYRCHGASQQKGGLRLDTVAAALKGGENGPALKPGASAQSLLMQAVRGEHDNISRMPYKKPPLPEPVIADLARWIDAGAPSPADEAPDRNIHWAFQTPLRPGVPATSSSRNTLHPIDAFVRARLAQDKIRPSPEADRATLLRRVSLDLTGLPPSPDEIDRFAGNRSADAYERIVEKLLASPHHGERWARWWLDAARYADSNGYSVDAPRSIWKYRDWVIAALNRDLPFDQFTIEQLAGDLLPAATLDQKIATGFHRNTQINQEGGIDPEQFRIESVMDRVNTTATVWLGVTLSCAQCHDHKFDPFTQREYYQFYAFFNSTIDDGHGKSTPNGMLDVPAEPDPTASTPAQLAEAEAELERYLTTQRDELARWEQSLNSEARAKLKGNVRQALDRPFAERTVLQKRAAYGAFKPEDPEFKQRVGKFTQLERNQPKPVTTLVMRELPKPRETRVFTKGDFTRPAAPVNPGVPAILHLFNAGTNATRADLARWLVDERNPLLARVIVNRVWQQYFGRGLVETENDFGTQGSLPSHPELLDWLACEFMQPTFTNAAPASPWSLKHLHRLIVTSATYRQSSKVRSDLARIDPLNKLLARQSRLRLDAEIVRDVALSASGLLNRTIGGPSVFPPQPDGVMNLGQSRREWKPSTGPDRYRRGMYTFFWRATPHPTLTVFDSADGFSACTRRIRSNTPLQALTLLNDEAFFEFAGALGRRLASAGLGSDAARIDHAFQLCVARKPSAAERRSLLALLQSQRAGTNTADAWTAVARVLLNLDETITRE
jgi:hypothetical protein